MPGPLPESLRMGVYEAYEKREYGQFMQRVVALQEGLISLEVAEADVFVILGYSGGVYSKTESYPVRDASSKSHRPDLYRMFVQWTTTAPPHTLCFDLLTSEVHVEDLKSLDKVLSMSQTMQTALCTGVCKPSVLFSFGAVRLLWEREISNRVSMETPH